LLTEGWRAMNARLDRIEAALEPAKTNTAALAPQSNIRPLRESA
jgi:hypothetical protein